MKDTVVNAEKDEQKQRMMEAATLVKKVQNLLKGVHVFSFERIFHQKSFRFRRTITKILNLQKNR